MDLIIEKQWFAVLLAFLGVVFYLAWARAREKRWIRSRFDEDKIIAMSFGVLCFGASSETGPPRGRRGFLLLMEDRLFYRGGFKKTELDIPAESVTRVRHGNTHRGVDLHHSVVKIDFTTPENIEETAAFKVPYPPQWISAIEKAFLSNRADSTRQV